MAASNPWLPVKHSRYEDILRAILDALPPPLGPYAGLTSSNLRLSTVPQLEAAVAHKWQLLGYAETCIEEEKLDKFFEKLEFTQHIGLLHRCCALDVLTRARALHIVDKMRRLLQTTCFVGVVGEENTGKSTLVQGMARHMGSSLDVPDRGLQCHTREVGGYEIRSGFWMVDFPGCNSIIEGVASSWQRFTNVPNFCVLLVRFTGDVDSHVASLYRQMKAASGDAQILVLLNKVDLTMQEVEEPPCPTFFSDCRARFALHLGCSHDEIVFCVLNPKRLTEELKSWGVVGVEEVCERIALQANVAT
eukprot:TRINITY_DN6370_c0_g1_i1.p1 TRINITY_DN6370_c0_g1~~TRINITY_DN6370_c0_g1_i1.p1  ORF type:complete len:314 (+),score=67.98 TRINITY_DN6370_c0_g1_i1:30-944(+)